MRDFLELFQLKRYGAIVLLIVFPIFSLCYYFLYIPSLITTRTFVTTCDESLDISISTPRFISNNSEINIAIYNNDREFGKLQISLIPFFDTRRNNARQITPSVAIEPITIDYLPRDSTDNKTVKVTTYGMQDGDLIEIRSIQIQNNSFSSNPIISCENRDSPNIIVYHRLYGLIISWLENLPTSLALLFFMSIISCAISEDNEQDFPLASQIGKYYIGRIFFRVVIILSTIYFILVWITYNFLEIWSSDVYLWHFGVSVSLVAISLIAIKTLAKLIMKKPKAKIVIDGTGKEKEIEIMTPKNDFNMQQFWDEISKQKKP